MTQYVLCEASYTNGTRYQQSIAISDDKNELVGMAMEFLSWDLRALHPELNNNVMFIEEISE